MTIHAPRDHCNQPLIQRISAGKKAGQSQEEGVALVIALLTGMLLIVGTTGLRSATNTRKLGAAESYQQMAETAAAMATESFHPE